MRGDDTGVLILEREGGGYIVIVQKPPSADVDVYIAGNRNRLYKMEQTNEIATMGTFTGISNSEAPSGFPADEKRGRPFEVVVDNEK